jgi:hypothetical protein
MKVDFDDGDGEINADREGGSAREQADEYEDAAKEFGESGEISSPARQAEAGDELNVVMQAAEYFVITVDDHYHAQSEAHNEKCKGL